jgi:hypothetical protein
VDHGGVPQRDLARRDGQPERREPVDQRPQRDPHLDPGQLLGSVTAAGRYALEKDFAVQDMPVWLVALLTEPRPAISARRW